MTKKFLSVILAIIMVFSSVPSMAVQIENSETAGGITPKGMLQNIGFEGIGTADDPYIIASASDFVLFTENMNSGETYKDKSFVQTADINLSGNAEYTGCDDAKYFHGIYDGQGYSINVDISDENKYVFSYVQGTIINLGFTGSISNTKVQGYGAPIRYLLDGSKLVNCYSTMTVTSDTHASGFAGTMLHGATAVNCYFAGTFAGSPGSAGGIYRAGDTAGDPTCVNCYSTVADKMRGETVQRPGVTIITEDAAKTTLADILNSGREEAAKTAGVSVGRLLEWKNSNGYPKHSVIEELRLDISSEMITEDHGTVTLSPYIRYSDGSLETKFDGMYYVTDSVVAQVKKNEDGTATVTAQMNGEITVTAVFPDGVTTFSKKITISGQAERLAANSFKVMMFGNSIRAHGKAEDMGWYGEGWGMAASSEDKDYAHRFIYYMNKKYGEGVAELVPFSTPGGFEAAAAACEEYNENDFKGYVDSFLTSVKKYNPDIVTIQLGENGGPAKSADAYGKIMAQIVKAIQAYDSDIIIVLSTPFWSDENDAKVIGTYWAGKECGIQVAPVNILGKGEWSAANKNMAFDAPWITETTTGGVKGHPGDVGMDNIAKMFFEKVNIILSADERTEYTTIPSSVEITVDGEAEITNAYGTLNLSAKVIPSDAAQGIIWSVDNKDIGSVDENGVVKALNNGKLTVTAKSKYVDTVYSTIEIDISGQTIPYTVTYDKNTTDTVTNMPKSNSLAKEDFIFDAVYPVRSTYKFLGWSLKADGTADDVLEIYDVKEDTTVYAVWEKAHSWSFERTDYKEEFTVENGFNEYVINGNFTTIATGTNLETGDVLKIKSPLLDLDASDYKYFVIRFRSSEAAADSVIDLFVKTTNGNVSFTKSIPNGDYNEYVFDLTGVTGTITGFEFKPTNVDTTIYIDEIAFVDNLGGDITGSGTKNDPYVIDSDFDFITFTNQMNGDETYQGKYFVQTADIDLAGNAAYTGCESLKFFKGTYDGQGHKINVNISAENKFVFSYVEGTIMNLGFTGSMTNTANNRCAPVLCLSNNAKLINCYSTLTVTAGNGNVAGFAGSMVSSATAVNCYFAGTFPNSPHSAGGIYRTGAEPAPTCINCYSTIADKMNNTSTVRPGVTVITEDVAKTTLADTLNSGRREAAETAGVSVDSIYAWTNKNGYPEQYFYIAPVDPGITGTGTKNDPYVIDSASDFITFTNQMNGTETYKDKYFVQTANIALSGNAEYTGCESNKYFAGTYDGQGHKIKVDISGENKYVFSFLQGTIMNLGFTGSITNTNKTGRSAPIGGMIDNAKLINCYSTMTVTGETNVAGFAGLMQKSTIAVNCYFAGTFVGSPVSAGGIYRTGDTPLPACTNCYSTIADRMNGAATERPGVTVITEDAAKTTLADVLNSGRNSAAEAAGVSVDGIYLWTNKNGYPEFSFELPEIEFKPEFVYDFANDGKGIADGVITVTRTDGGSAYTSAEILFADNDGILKNYTPFGSIEFENGTGSYTVSGNRAFPKEATRLAVKFVGDGFAEAYYWYTIPEEHRTSLEDEPLYSFWAVSDMHLGINYNSDYWATMTVNRDNAMKDIFASDADFVFVNGDVVNYGTTTYINALDGYLDDRINNSAYNTKNMPVFLINGNHEYFNTSSQPKGFDYESVEKTFSGQLDYLEETFGEDIKITRGAEDELWYAVDYKGVKLIFLSTPQVSSDRLDGSSKTLSDEQLTFLDEQLYEGEKSGKTSYVITHVPLQDTIPADSKGKYEDGLLNTDAVNKILAKHPNVIVFSAHTHSDLSVDDAHFTVVNNMSETPSYINDGCLVWTTGWEGKGDMANGTQTIYKKNFGTGVYLEVYGDKILVKSRQFLDESVYFGHGVYLIDVPNGNKETADVAISGSVENGATLKALVNGEVPADNCGYTYEWYIGDKIVSTEKTFKIDGKNFYPGKRVALRVFFEDGTYASAITETRFDNEDVIADEDFVIGTGDYEKYIVNIGKEVGVCNRIAAAYDDCGTMVGVDIINNSYDADGIVTVNVAKSLDSDYVKIMSFDVSGNLKVLTEDVVSYGNLIVNGDGEGTDKTAFYSSNGTASIVEDDERGKVWEVVPNEKTLYTYIRQKFEYIPGATYKATAFVKLVGVSASNDVSGYIISNTVFTDGDGNTDHIQAQKSAKAGTWIPMEYTFTVPESAMSNVTDEFTFFANPISVDGKSYGAIFRIDDVNVQLLDKPVKQEVNEMFENNPFEGKEEINIVFLGGSITEGYHSSTPAKSYVGRCTRWLKKAFPNQTVNCYNAGIGGTGSDFGMVRMDRDVMSKDPDMIFVEFAVNDTGRDSRATMDSIMRRILEAEKTPYVVFLYTTNKEYTTDSSYHHQVAAYYGIPEIDLQAALKEATDGQDPLVLGLFTDGVHPADGGFEVYANAITERLSDENCYVKPQNKAPMTNDSVTFSANFEPAPNFSHSDGWTERIGHRDYRALYTTTPGETITFEFDGNFLAIEGGYHRESALVDIYVDDVLVKTESFYYDMVSFQSNYREISHTLSMGHHTGKIVVREETDPAHPGSTMMLYHIITGTAE